MRCPGINKRTTNKEATPDVGGGDEAMNAVRSAMIRRYAFACAVALLFTVLLLFVMTRLIAPVDDDPMVSRMIRQLELRRDPAPELRIEVPEFEPPPKPELEEAERSVDIGADRLPRPAAVEEPEDAAPDVTTDPVDWWAAARSIARQVGEDDFEQWLKSQDRSAYVSIMQGPIPAAAKAKEPEDGEELWSIYVDVYGDKVIQVSDNCTLRAQTVFGDYSSFVRNLPPLVTCYEPKVIDMSGLEDYLQGDTAPANR